MKIILGSSSKFRQKILAENGYEFEVMKPDIDEKAIQAPGTIGPRDSSDPSALVLAICAAKAEALLSRINDQVLLITCDQVIAYQDKIREKPINEKECSEYLKSYENYPAVTVSGIKVTNTKTGQSAQGVEIAKQYFRSIPSEIVDELIKKGDIMHCAGGFMIDDDLIHPYLDRREGTEDSIIGMPLNLLHDLLSKVNKS